MDSVGSKVCNHESIYLTPSPFARSVGFTQPSAQQLFTAATGKRNRVSTENPSPNTFPGPLILPEDELALDPRYPRQSFRYWLNGRTRNEVSKERSKIYVSAPTIGAEVDFVQSWTSSAKIPNRKRHSGHMSAWQAPYINDVIDHLSAFYYGLEIQLLPSELRFTKWEETEKTLPKFIGLATATDCTRIRVRGANHLFPAQLNLNDLLDVAISTLPSDAYALLMIVNHDLYEDDDDDFACGRAYGGSRVAVVSTARYAPELDELQGVERVHAWPASHCKTYVESLCKVSSDKGPTRKRQHPENTTMEEIGVDGPATLELPHTLPMQAAINAHASISFANLPPFGLYSLYLQRVVRTAAHELGHCFGLDHCVYYACLMQGTSSLAEDVRQPPYLCPVCLAKLGRAVAGEKNEEVKIWELKRYKFLLAVCRDITVRGGEAGFGALETWIKSLLLPLQDGS
jgi:archaemetzincin